MVLCAGLFAAMALTSCKSSESAYKKAYEKAKAQEAEQSANQPIQSDSDSTRVVTPLQTKPADQTTVMDNVDNATVRKENVTVVSGQGLKSFSVVVGSFSLKANAEGLQNTLKNAGYQAQVAYNSSRNMYRVIASTFDDKLSAVQSRNQFRAGNYPDAWLLFKE